MTDIQRAELLGNLPTGTANAPLAAPVIAPPAPGDALDTAALGLLQRFHELIDGPQSAVNVKLLGAWYESRRQAFRAAVGQ